jgi:hypothetical protein
MDNPVHPLTLRRLTERQHGWETIISPPIIINLLGALLFGLGMLLGIMVGACVSLFTRDEQASFALGGLVAFSVMTLGDVWYRWGHHRQKGFYRFISPTTGGAFYFIPIWIFFGALPVGGVMVLEIHRLFTVP